MVIPIIPEKKEPVIVIANKIPTFVFSFDFTLQATNDPRDTPANEPTTDNRIIKDI